MFATADLSDANPGLAILTLELRAYGGRAVFSGPVRTVSVFEDNVLVSEALEDVAPGSVLVVDGEGSRRCALLGDRLGGIAADRGLAGVVINGCVRDSSQLSGLDVGILAIGTSPRRSAKERTGERDADLLLGGVPVQPGDHLYADSDGVLVSPTPLI